MRMMFAALLLVTLLPATAHGEESAGGGRIKWLIAGMIAAQAADIATTSLALSRGCVERTYYGIQNKWAIGGMKSGGAIALAVTLPFTHNTKPKVTKGLAWAQIASGVIGASVNATRLPGCR
jgi:hypothetical protein